MRFCKCSRVLSCFALLGVAACEGLGGFPPGPATPGAQPGKPDPVASDGPSAKEEGPEKINPLRRIEIWKAQLAPELRSKVEVESTAPFAVGYYQDEKSSLRTGVIATPHGTLDMRATVCDIELKLRDVDGDGRPDLLLRMCENGEALAINGAEVILNRMDGPRRVPVQSVMLKELIGTSRIDWETEEPGVALTVFSFTDAGNTVERIVWKSPDLLPREAPTVEAHVAQASLNALESMAPEAAPKKPGKLVHAPVGMFDQNCKLENPDWPTVTVFFAYEDPDKALAHDCGCKASLPSMPEAFCCPGGASNYPRGDMTSCPGDRPAPKPAAKPAKKKAK